MIDAEGIPRTSYNSSKLDQIKVVFFFEVSVIDEFFQCERIFIPGWRHLFPEIAEIAKKQVISISQIQLAELTTSSSLILKITQFPRFR